MKARAVALDLQRAIDESGLKISELVESRSFRKLSALFGSYYKNQLSADFMRRLYQHLCFLSSNTCGDT